MSEMSERVANAIGCQSPDRCTRKWVLAYEKKSACETCMEVARDAIETMQEPIEAMIAAGFSALAKDEPGPSDLAEAYRRMIEAMLK